MLIFYMKKKRYTLFIDFTHREENIFYLLMLTHAYSLTSMEYILRSSSSSAHRCAKSDAVCRSKRWMRRRRAMCTMMYKRCCWEKICACRYEEEKIDVAARYEKVF